MFRARTPQLLLEDLIPTFLQGRHSPLPAGRTLGPPIHTFHGGSGFPPAWSPRRGPGKCGIHKHRPERVLGQQPWLRILLPPRARVSDAESAASSPFPSSPWNTPGTSAPARILIVCSDRAPGLGVPPPRPWRTFCLPDDTDAPDAGCVDVEECLPEGAAPRNKWRSLQC